MRAVSFKVDGPFYMMKNTLLLILGLFAGTAVYAQKNLLALNEQNHYTYFMVKPAPATLNADALAKYIKKNVAGVKTAEAVAETGGVTGKGIVLVYKQGLVTSQEEGQISYNLSVDFKDNKYRLILTDFAFTPYQRNRYGVFAPVDGSITPLEEGSVKISAKQLEAYLDKLGAYGAKFGKQVNDYVTNPAAVKATPAGLKKVDTKNW